jgi:hypothetical protein
MKVNPNKGAHEADVECPCFHCFMTFQEPAFAKALSICKVFHKWCGQDKYDWARALFAHLQYLLQSNEPLVPHLEKIIEEGLPQHFLAMLSDDYFDYLPTLIRRIPNSMSCSSLRLYFNCIRSTTRHQSDTIRVQSAISI